MNLVHRRRWSVLAIVVFLVVVGAVAGFHQGRPAPLIPLTTRAAATLAGPSSNPARAASASLAARGVEKRPVHRGLVMALEQARGRSLSSAERRAVHDILRETVESWRAEQAAFVEQAATLLGTSTDVIDRTLPRRGWQRLGATRDAAWTHRLEQALGHPLSEHERQGLVRLQEKSHARTMATRAKANQRLAQTLGLKEADIDQAWPESPLTRSSSGSR